MLDDKALPKLITFDEGDEEDRGGAGPELPASVKKMCLGAGAQVWTINNLISLCGFSTLVIGMVLLIC